MKSVSKALKISFIILLGISTKPAQAAETIFEGSTEERLLKAGGAVLVGSLLAYAAGGGEHETQKNCAQYGLLAPFALLMNRGVELGLCGLSFCSTVSGILGAMEVCNIFSQDQTANLTTTTGLVAAIGLSTFMASKGYNDAHKAYEEKQIEGNARYQKICEERARAKQLAQNTEITATVPGSMA